MTVFGDSCHVIEQIGNYRIKEKIADGGVGRVYAARHALLERRVAIKVLHEHYADDPDFRARFLREARAMAALDHPNIARIFDFGEDDGQFFLVMELIEGGSVRTLLQEQDGPLDTRLAVELIRQTAAGLAYAHELDMIHRDIKPGNLLLDATEASQAAQLRTVKITDFGLVRLTDSTEVTAAGVALGTASYMSPEQCLGREIDLRSDIYSLGVVLFELLTGRVPFEGGSSAEVAEMHVHQPPTEPKHLVPTVPDALNAITLRCLAKIPASRYRTCDELLADLSDLAVLDDQLTERLAVDVSLPAGDGSDGGAIASTPDAQTRDVSPVDPSPIPGSSQVPVSITVKPEVVTGRLLGRYQVEVATEGEQPARVEIDAGISGSRMRIRVQPATVVVTPDGAASSRLTVIALPRFAFEPESRALTVRVAAAGGMRADATAGFVHQPLSSGWMPFAAIGALLTIVLCMVAGAIFAAITDTQPFGIGLEESEGSLLVADQSGPIYRLDESGESVGMWSPAGDDAITFSAVAAMVADDGASLYVVDSGAHRIWKFSIDGELLASWGQQGTGPGEFDQPVDAGIGPEGRVYVVDRGNDRIQVFESDGTFVEAYGEAGSDRGQFESPNAIAFDRVGNFYVADSGNNRIQKLQSFGTFLIAWGDPGLAAGEFDQPLDVAVDADGNVYVADYGNGRIQKFDFDGRYITAWSGAPDGTFTLEAPMTVQVIQDRVYVFDEATGAIAIYSQDGAFEHLWLDPGTGAAEWPAQPRGIVALP